MNVLQLIIISFLLRLSWIKPCNHFRFKIHFDVLGSWRDFFEGESAIRKSSTFRIQIRSIDCFTLITDRYFEERLNLFMC
jgi:hypothetical protein